MEHEITVVTIITTLCLVSALYTLGVFSRRRMLFIDIGPTEIVLSTTHNRIIRRHSNKQNVHLSADRLQRCLAEVVREYSVSNKLWFKPYATLCVNKGNGSTLTAEEVRKLQTLYIGCVNSRIVDSSSDRINSHILAPSCV